MISLIEAYLRNEFDRLYDGCIIECTGQDMVHYYQIYEPFSLEGENIYFYKFRVTDHSGRFGDMHFIGAVPYDSLKVVK